MLFRSIGNLLIEFTLRHPNFPNFFEQVFKIFFIEYQAVFKALFVKDVALYRKIAQNISCPRPELRRADGIHAVPHGNDGVKIIELGVVGFTVSYPFLQASPKLGSLQNHLSRYSRSFFAIKSRFGSFKA